MKSLTIIKSVVILILASSLAVRANPVEAVNGELAQEPSGLSLYDTLFALATTESGGQATIQVQVSEFAEQVTATVFMYAGETPFSMSWLGRSVYYEGSAWYEGPNGQGSSIVVEADSFNQIDWKIDNLRHTSSVFVDGKLLVLTEGQQPTWSSEVDPQIISIQTDADGEAVTWTNVSVQSIGAVSVMGVNDSPELADDPLGEFPRIEAIGYQSNLGTLNDMTEAEKLAYRDSLLEMVRTLDSKKIRKALKKRKNRDHLSTDHGLFTPLHGNH